MKLRTITAAATAICICLSMTACGSKSEEEQIEDKLESISEKDIDSAAKELGLDDGNTKSKSNSASEESAETVEFDPFEYLDISFNEKSPYGKVKVSVDKKGNDPFKKLSFNVDDAGVNLANGDTITVIADVDEKEGYIPSKTEMTYTVEGLDEYLMKLDDLPDDVNEKFKKQADDMLTSYNAGLGDDCEVKSSDFIGNYLLTIKTDGDYGYGNRLFYIYKTSAVVTGEDDDGNKTKDTLDYIWYTYIDDVYKLNDGTWVVDTSNMVSAENEFYLFDKWFSGYENIDSFFSNEIAIHSSDSEYETNIEK